MRRPLTPIPLLTLLFSALVVPPGAQAEDRGWLGTSPPATDSAPAEPLPEVIPAWLQGEPGDPRPVGLPGYPTELIRFELRGSEPLGEALQLLRRVLGRDVIRTIDLPENLAFRPVRVWTPGTLEQTLEQMMAYAGVSLWLAGGTLHARDGYRPAPFQDGISSPRPDVPARRLFPMKLSNVRNIELGSLLRTIGSLTGVVPTVARAHAHRKVSLRATGHFGQVLEVLASTTELRLFVDGPYLRVVEGWAPRPVPADPGDPLPELRFQATDIELGSLLRTASTLTRVQVCVPTRYQPLLVSLEHRGPVEELMAKIQAELLRRGVEVEAFRDREYLRVQPRAEGPRQEAPDSARTPVVFPDPDGYGRDPLWELGEEEDHDLLDSDLGFDDDDFGGL